MKFGYEFQFEVAFCRSVFQSRNDNSFKIVGKLFTGLEISWRNLLNWEGEKEM